MNQIQQINTQWAVAPALEVLEAPQEAIFPKALQEQVQRQPQAAKHILIVEDDVSLREWIEFELTFAGYQVTTAADGLSALAALRSMPAPDLILLDVQLPGMNGFEICNTIQQWPETAGVPVIFLTARGALEDKLHGFEVGGVDYLTKPFKMAELKARIQALLRSQERQRTQLLKEATQYLDEEMAEAALIQKALMSRPPANLPGLDIYATCRPAKAVGGDIYDIYVQSGSHLHLAVADVSGKGLAAAMITAQVRTILREATRTLASPAAALAQVNAHLYEDLAAIGKFVTLFTGVYVPAERSLRYANAGHSVAIYRPSGGPPQILEPTGMPLGILQDTQYEEAVLPFARGDLLMVCSDGFPEAFNQAGEMFGYARLLRILDDVAQEKTAAEIGATLLAEVSAFMGNCEQSDDQTLIVMKGTDER